MARIGGSRRKKAALFSKPSRKKGKVSLRDYLAEYKEGDMVSLVFEPSIHKGSYYPRFVGRMGVVKGRSGSCYEVSIMDAGKPKTLIVHPVHLKKAGGVSKNV
jgi:large subunit ribosomal protein L21e